MGTLQLSCSGRSFHTSPSEVEMSLTVFLAICILSCDFLLYVLFQWVYGEKHRKHARRVAARDKKRGALSSKDADTPRVVTFPERSMQYRTGYY